MIINCEDEEYRKQHWYQVIDSLLKKNKIEISDLSVENDTLTTVLQDLLGDPFTSSFNELEKVKERLD